MKKVLLFLCLGALLLNACKKGTLVESYQLNNSKNTGQILSDTSSLITESAANANNPYDAYGAVHNEIVNATISTWKNPAATVGDFYDAIIATGMDTLDKPIMSKDSVLMIASSIDTNTNLIAFVNSCSVSEMVKSYLDSLLNMIDYDRFKTYAGIKLRIDSLENSVLLDPNLQNSEKALILKASSIERYSLKYWSNYLYMTKSNQDTQSIAMRGSVGNWIRAQGQKLKEHLSQIVGSDAIGAGTAVIKALGSGTTDPKALAEDGAMGAVINSITTVFKGLILGKW